MTALTRVAKEIFAPYTAAGVARGPNIVHARIWGAEIERATFQEGSWNVGLSFETAGNQNIVLSSDVVRYARIGRLYTLSLNLTTSTFTHTTASGPLRITGLPIVGGAAVYRGPMTDTQGITKANYTRFSGWVPEGADYILLAGSGSGQSISPITTADMPTGGSVILRGTIPVLVDNE